jgi:hypothetical protein
MGLFSNLFGKQPEAEAPRKRMCIQCGEILPKHVDWCPIEAEAKAKERQSA